MQKSSRAGVISLCLVAATLLGCSRRLGTDPYRAEIPVPPTEVALVISADSELTNRIDIVRIEVADTTTDVPRNGRDLQATVDPVRLTILPTPGDEEGTYAATIRILDADNQELGVQTLVGDYVKDELREVWVAFDEACELSDCPAGFRCQLGECVEHCVPTEEPGTTTRTGAIACGQACDANTCQPLAEGIGGNLLRCTDGYYTVEQQCGFGCDTSGLEPKCKGLIPHNVPEIPIVPGFAGLVVGQGGVDEVILNTDDGTVEFRTGDSTTIADAEELDVGFQVVDQGTVEVAFRPPGDGFFDPVDIPAAYGVFSMETLVVLEEATLSARGSRPVILLVNQDVVILGAISVAATKQNPGPGGFEGGCEEGEAGQGPSPGGPGTVGQGSSAGGGGGYAWSGGYGGEGVVEYGGESIPGGASGWPLALADDGISNPLEVPPLFGGSGGGAGTDNDEPVPCGGHGGGAIQISTNSRVRFGPRGLINAGGSGGGGAHTPYSAGGGGSGGAVWIEAGKVLWPDSTDGLVVGATGGAGGAVTFIIGAPELRGNAGSDGHPWEVPALGGTSLYGGAGLSGGFGGDGSNRDGYVQNGQLALFNGFELGAGGGGGGAGHLRFYTAAGEGDREALIEVVTPRGDMQQVVVEQAVTE